MPCTRLCCADPRLLPWQMLEPGSFRGSDRFLTCRGINGSLFAGRRNKETHCPPYVHNHQKMTARPNQ